MGDRARQQPGGLQMRGYGVLRRCGARRGSRDISRGLGSRLRVECGGGDDEVADGALRCGTGRGNGRHGDGRAQVVPTAVRCSGRRVQRDWCVGAETGGGRAGDGEGWPVRVAMASDGRVGVACAVGNISDKTAQMGVADRRWQMAL